MSRFAELRELLSHPPTQARWKELIKRMIQWPQVPERDVAIQYAQAHLSHWPDELRTLRDDLRYAYSQEPAHPTWSLVRTFYIFIKALSSDDHTQSLTTLTHVPGLTSLRLVFYPEFLANVAKSKSPAKVSTSLFSNDLQHLSHVGLRDLEGFDVLDTLQQLKRLELFNYPLPRLGALPQLQGLTELLLSCQAGLEDLDMLHAFPKLQWLRFEESPLVSFQHRTQLPELDVLELDNSGWHDSFDWSIFSSIHTLHLTGERKRYELGKTNLSPLRNLHTLTIKGGAKLLITPNLDALATLSALTHLELDAFAPQPDLSFLESLTALEHLTLSGYGIGYKRQLFCFSALKELRSLHLEQCGSLDLEPFCVLPKLEELVLEFDVPSVHQLDMNERNERLRAYRAPTELTAFSHIRSLTLKQARFLNDLSFVRELTQLEALHIYECLHLRWLEDLKSCIKLKTLTLHGSRALEHLDSMLRPEKPPLFDWGDVDTYQPREGLRELHSLSLLDMHNLRDIQGLSTYTKLRTLHISGCENLRVISAIRHLIELETLYIEDCPSLEELDALITLPQLSTLVLRDCPALPCPPDKDSMYTYEDVKAFQQRLRDRADQQSSQ